jgi:hypothetical protein
MEKTKLIAPKEAGEPLWMSLSAEELETYARMLHAMESERCTKN